MGSLLEKEGVKSSDGSILGDCDWTPGRRLGFRV